MAYDGWLRRLWPNLVVARIARASCARYLHLEMQILVFLQRDVKIQKFVADGEAGRERFRLALDEDDPPFSCLLDRHLGLTGGQRQTEACAIEPRWYLLRFDA